MLNDLYTAFDNSIDNFKVYKVCMFVLIDVHVTRKPRQHN